MQSNQTIESGRLCRCMGCQLNILQVYRHAFFEPLMKVFWDQQRAQHPPRSSAMICNEFSRRTVRQRDALDGQFAKPAGTN